TGEEPEHGPQAISERHRRPGRSLLIAGRVPTTMATELDHRREQPGAGWRLADRDHSLDRNAGALRKLEGDLDLVLEAEQRVAKLRQGDHLHVPAERHPVRLDQASPRRGPLQRVEHSRLGGDDEFAVWV